MVERCRCVRVRYVVDGINVSQKGEAYRSNKGHCLTGTHGENLSLGLLHQHQVHGDAVNRDSIYAIKTLLPTVELT
jgi:hypothetical protein